MGYMIRKIISQNNNKTSVEKNLKYYPDFRKEYKREKSNIKFERKK